MQRGAGRVAKQEKALGEVTHQLDGGHVLLPPQKLLEAWPCCRKAIVEVHDDMDSGVHHGVERTHSTCGKQGRTRSVQVRDKIGR